MARVIAKVIARRKVPYHNDPSGGVGAFQCTALLTGGAAAAWQTCAMTADMVVRAPAPFLPHPVSIAPGRKRCWAYLPSFATYRGVALDSMEPSAVL